jgi:hypothetical protein
MTCHQGHSVHKLATILQKGKCVLWLTITKRVKQIQSYGMKSGGDPPSKPTTYAFYEQFYVTGSCEKVPLVQTLGTEMRCEWVHLVRRPLFGLLSQPWMIDEGCGAVSGMRISRGNGSTRRKPATVPLCPPQIPDDVTWVRTRAAAVWSRRLTAWLW